MCLAWTTTELLFILWQQSQQDGVPIQLVFSWTIKVADNWLNILWFFCILTCSTTLLAEGISQTVKLCIVAHRWIKCITCRIITLCTVVQTVVRSFEKNIGNGTLLGAATEKTLNRSTHNLAEVITPGRPLNTPNGISIGSAPRKGEI